MSESRIARKLGADAAGRLLVHESIQQQSQGDAQVKLEGVITAVLDPVRKLPLETRAHIVLSREDNGQWIKLPIRLTFIYVDVN